MCTRLFPVSHHSLVELCLPSAIIQSHLSSSWRFSLYNSGVFYSQILSVKPQPRLISSCWLMDPGVSAVWTSKPSGLLLVAWWASLTSALTGFRSASLLCFCLLHVFRYVEGIFLHLASWALCRAPYWVINRNLYSCIHNGVCFSHRFGSVQRGSQNWVAFERSRNPSIAAGCCDQPTLQRRKYNDGYRALTECFIIYSLEDALLFVHLNPWKQHLKVLCVIYAPLVAIAKNMIVCYL